MSYANARIYHQLFSGVPDNDRYTDLVLALKVGGHQAFYDATRYQLSVYGREHINGANLVTLHRQYISSPDAEVIWRMAEIEEHNIDAHAVRCLVVKVESLTEDSAYTEQGTPTRTYADQESMVDPPAWGIRMTSAKVCASSLGLTVRPEDAVGDMVKPWWPGERYFCPSESNITLGQLSFNDIPKTRVDAVEETNGLLYWDYEATPDWFRYEAPYTAATVPDEMLYTVSLADPRVTWALKPAFEECCNAVRVIWTGNSGRPRETVAHAESSVLGSLVRADVVVAPVSIRSKKGAMRLAKLWLEQHVDPPVNGRLVLIGKVKVATGEVRDVMMIEPGEFVKLYDAPPPYNRAYKVTRTSKDFVSHTCDVEFGLASRRFDRWLNRLAAKARIVRR